MGNGVDTTGRRAPGRGPGRDGDVLVALFGWRIAGLRLTAGRLLLGDLFNALL